MSSNTMPLVSIVVLNWNNFPDTRNCLAMLRTLDYSRFEIIVVDNGSVDGSTHNLEKEGQFFTLIKAPKNLGFAGGNNIGIKAARGDYILLLNNDTIIENSFLTPLVKFMENDRSVGAVSPKICYQSPQNTIQYAGGGSFDWFRGRFSFRGWQENDKGQFETPQITTSIHGAAALIRKSVIAEIGPLNAAFFAYYEEIEWSLRIRRAGYKICYIPANSVIHKASSTVKKSSPFRLMLMTRNRIWLNRLYAGPLQQFIFLLYFHLAAIPWNLFHLAPQQRSSFFSATLQGFYTKTHHFREAPHGTC